MASVREWAGWAWNGVTSTPGYLYNGAKGLASQGFERYAPNFVQEAYADWKKGIPREELTASMNSLGAIEKCWQADSRPNHYSLWRLAGMSHVQEIPKEEMEKTVATLENISTVWKRFQAMLIVLAVAAVSIAAYSVVPLCALSVIIPAVAAVITYDAARAIRGAGMIYKTIDAFCQAKRAEGLPAYGATTKEQRSKWSQQFAAARTEFDAMLIRNLMGWSNTSGIKA